MINDTQSYDTGGKIFSFLLQPHMLGEHKGVTEVKI